MVYTTSIYYPARGVNRLALQRAVLRTRVVLAAVDAVRFNWRITAPGVSQPLVIGFDVAVPERGRIRNVYGFLEVPVTATGWVRPLRTA